MSKAKKRDYDKLVAELKLFHHYDAANAIVELLQQKQDFKAGCSCYLHLGEVSLHEENCPQYREPGRIKSFLNC